MFSKLNFFYDDKLTSIWVCEIPCIHIRGRYNKGNLRHDVGPVQNLLSSIVYTSSCATWIVINFDNVEERMIHTSHCFEHLGCVINFPTLKMLLLISKTWLAEVYTGFCQWKTIKPAYVRGNRLLAISYNNLHLEL